MPDPFDVLGINPQFNVDAAAVERAWLRKTARLHPDRAADPDAAARELAHVNAARGILVSAERRANAFLKCLGGPTKEEDNALPDGFLMEIFDLRQEIEGIMRSRDEAAIAEVERQAAEQRRSYIERVGGMFEALPESPSPDALHAIRLELNAWRYIERLIEQLDPEYDPNRADFDSA